MQPLGSSYEYFLGPEMEFLAKDKLELQCLAGKDHSSLPFQMKKIGCRA